MSWNSSNWYASNWFQGFWLFGDAAPPLTSVEAQPHLLTLEVCSRPASVTPTHLFEDPQAPGGSQLVVELPMQVVDSSRDLLADLDALFLNRSAED
jgi:hypothetical protein